MSNTNQMAAGKSNADSTVADSGLSKDKYKNLSENKKLQILESIKGIIETEFIKKKFYACALPAAFMFYEVAAKYGCRMEPTCGTLVYDGSGLQITSNSHYWNEYKDVIYDPTLKVMKHLENRVDIKKFSYIKGKPNLRGEDDVQMLWAFHLFLDTRSADFYFDAAPSNVVELRDKIYERASKKLKDILKGNK